MTETPRNAESGDNAEFRARLEAVMTRKPLGCAGLVSVERLSAGASQETYRVVAQTPSGEARFALRRAAGGVAAEAALGLRTEARLMTAAAAAGVPAPKVRCALDAADGLGEGFIMDWLEGETLGARIVRSDALAAARGKLAFQCGQALAGIHAMDLPASGLDDALEAHSPAELVHASWDQYKAFATPQPMIDYTARWLLRHLPEGFEPGLVHGDFRNGNLMVDAAGIVAVLDWELAHIGDAMRDLGWICTNSWRFGGNAPVGGFGSYADLFQGYESVSGRPVDAARVRFWEVFGSFWWAVGCLSMADRYRTGPDRTVERPGIGRRSSECQIDCVNLLLPGPVRTPAPATLRSDLDMPRTDELLASVRDFLRQDVMPNTAGRTSFLARVAANSLDIALREQALGPVHRAAELAGLQAIFNSDEGLRTLRWRLVNGLRNGAVALDRTDVAEHLRRTVATQVAIDQPRYAGLKTALAFAAPEGT